MVLENFIVDAPIVWDRVGKKIFENPHVKQGRKMRVQITNAGMVEDLSGYTLALGWKHTVSGVDGLDVFEDSSEANVGIFEMAYTENLMTNLGNLKASLVLTSVEDMVVAESNDFYVKVDDSPFGADAEQGVGSYTRLAEILLNEESRIAAEVARVSAEETRVTDFNALVDSEIIAQNVATKLQAKEAEYLPRLVSNEQQLAEIDREKISRGNVSVSDINKNLGKFDQTYMTDEFMQQMAGNAPINATVANLSQTSNKIAPKAITPEKTTFINWSSNLFNKNEIINNKAIDAAGNLIDSTGFGVSRPIPIAPNKSYTGYRMAKKAFYTSDGAFILANTTDGTFTSPAGAFSMIIQYNNGVNNLLNKVQLNEGSVLLPYEEYWERLSDKTKISINAFKEHQIAKPQLPSNVVSTYNADFIVPSSNLYYYNRKWEGFALSSSGGTFLENSSYIMSDFIRIEQGQVYTLSPSVTRWAFYDFNQNHIKTYSASGDVPKTVNAEGVLMRIHYLKIRGKESVQINKGINLLQYEKGGSTFNDEIKIPANKVENLQENLDVILKPNWETEHKYVTHTDFNKVFTCPDLPTMDSASGNFLHQYRSADFYALYDDLVEEYPDYVSRTLLGYDASGSLPIYRYDFKPADIITSNMAEGAQQETKFPKAILVSGSHPEFIGAYGTYSALNQITRRWEEDEALETLRWNVHFIVLPVWSPWSIDNGYRYNYNLVNPSRNFPHDFKVTVQGQNDWGGTTPLSEPETQYLYNVLVENKDALVLIDFHNMGHSNDFIWVQPVSMQTLAISKAHIVQMTRKWDKERGLKAPSNLYNGYVGYTNKNTYCSPLTQAETFDIRGLTYEVTLYDLWDANLTSYTSRVVTLATEAFVNYLLLILRATIEEKNNRIM